MYDKGFVVFTIKDLELFEFEFYYTDGKTIDVKYEETREETIDRILFTIDCSELDESDTDIDVMLKCIYNYVVGILSVNVLSGKHKIIDHSSIFKGTNFNE